MQTELVPLDLNNFVKVPGSCDIPPDIRMAYFYGRSISYCLLADGIPVVAGGVIDQLWNRGEAWVLPNPWFYSHMRICFRYMRDIIPVMAIVGGFKRIQCTCPTTVSASLFEHLGFTFEGVMAHFGRNGERCYMYAKIF